MTNDYNLEEARNRLVAKDNRLIQNSRYSLDTNENKAVLYLISKIQPEDEPGKIYEFNCREFQALIRWGKDASYKKIKQMLKKLGDMSWWVDLENGEESLVRWFNIVRMDPGTGRIKIKFHEDMFPYLLELNQRTGAGQYFTSYKIQNVTLMKHKYSPRLYEILKSYQYNNKRWTFENGTGTQHDLQRMLGDVVLDEGKDKGNPIIPETWSNWAVFKRDVLKPAIREINKYTDIKVAYEGKKQDLHRKKTRAIRSIEFYMVGKTGPEQRNTDNVIDAEYREIEDRRKCHQMTWDELSVAEKFFKEHGESLAEERKQKELFESDRRDEKANKSKHPILFAELNNERDANLDEKKMEQLYKTAISGRVAGYVELSEWELFATDIITYYYDKIAATPEETKTTIYQRLLDCVKRDYDNETGIVIGRYRRN